MDDLKARPKTVRQALNEARTRITALEAQFAARDAEIAGLREALETAHRVVLWAACRTRTPAYANVLENDARNIANAIAKADDEKRGYLVAPGVHASITRKDMTA